MLMLINESYDKFQLKVSKKIKTDFFPLSKVHETPWIVQAQKSSYGLYND